MDYLIVFAGGGLGAALRLACNRVASGLWGSEWPWGTLLINVSGSLMMGVIVELAVRKAGLPEQARLFIATGILGGYTTFSAFSMEAGMLHARGDTAAAIAYALGSVILGIAAFFLGTHASRNVFA